MAALTECNSQASAARPAGRRLRVRPETSARARDGESDDAAMIFEQEGVTVAVVADGLGAAKEGRPAARRTVATLQQNFSARPSHWSAGRACAELVRHLNRRLWQEGMARFEAPELACTVAVAALEGDRLFVLNAGDSRVYLWRRGELSRLTTDHRTADPRQAHVLTSAVGLAEELALASAEISLCADDLILLCTDGVTDVLDDDALRELLRQSSGAAKIIAETARRSTRENCDDATAVTLRVVSVGEGRQPRALAPAVPKVLRAGQVVDGYTLRQSFRANDRIWLASRAGDTFILKFPPSAAADDEAALAVFVREAWHAAQLQSTFFPAAFVPADATVRFYVQEYFHAPTLRKVLADNGPLGAAETVELGRFLLRAEQFLLGHGFVHGDLKPENILVWREGQTLRFKLVDLGSVAEVFSLQGRAGTPSYLAPERFAGASLTERSEIFAIGVVLYEALTNRLPYGEIEPFQKPAFGNPRLVAALNQHVPPWLDSVVLRAIVAAPDRRQQHYSEMLFELENPSQVRPFFQAGTPLLERNPALFYKIAFLIAFAAAVLFGILLAQQAHK